MREGLRQSPSSDDGPDIAKPKREALTKGISKRLRPICSRMPSAEFDAMVQQMADIELKYANLTTPSQPQDRGDCSPAHHALPGSSAR